MSRLLRPKPPSDILNPGFINIQRETYYLNPVLISTR